MSYKLFNNKKAINDISIIAIIISIFLITAITVPYLNEEFDQDLVQYDTDGLEQDLKDDAESVSTLNAFSVLITVIKLAVWDFGNTLNLPIWLDIVFTLLAIIFILVVARNIWIGGGG